MQMTGTLCLQLKCHGDGIAYLVDDYEVQQQSRREIPLWLSIDGGRNITDRKIILNSIVLSDNPPLPFLSSTVHSTASALHSLHLK